VTRVRPTPTVRLTEARRALEAGRALRVPGAADLAAALDLAEAGQPAEAVACLSSLAAAEPGVAAAQLFLGFALDAAGQRSEAVATLAAALRNDVDDYDCLYLIGDALTDWDAPEQGCDAFDRAIALAPHSSRAHLARGRARSACGDVTSAIRDMRRATLLEPGLVAAHVALGDELRAAGMLDGAAQSYHRALALDPASGDARSGLDAALLLQVPAWHAAMLNDTGRNEAFDRAIRRAVRPGMHVLDIGAGTGLLAMMAARAGATHVTACESVEMLAESAYNIIIINGLKNKVNVIHKHSTALAPGTDMDRPADLLVAEIVDCGLLSEGVLETIADARSRLLAPGASIIPRAATVFAMPVESAALESEQRVSTVAGFDLSPVNAILPRSYRQIDLHRYAWRPLAAPVELFRFDFATATPAADDREIRLVPMADGTAHAVVAWFRLELDDEISIASGPFDPPTHWRQAVFPLANPVDLNQNEPVRLSASHDGRTIRLALSAGASRRAAAS